MTTFELSDNNQVFPTSLFHDCESAYKLIEEGKEKQAEETFPLEYYLIKKYLFADFKNLSDLLEKRLTV